MVEPYYVTWQHQSHQDTESTGGNIKEMGDAAYAKLNKKPDDLLAHDYAGLHGGVVNEAALQDGIPGDSGIAPPFAPKDAAEDTSYVEVEDSSDDDIPGYAFIYESVVPPEKQEKVQENREAVSNEDEVPNGDRMCYQYKWLLLGIQIGLIVFLAVGVPCFFFLTQPGTKNRGTTAEGSMGDGQRPTSPTASTKSPVSGGIITLHQDPSFEPLDSPNHTLTFISTWPVNDRYLMIKGSNLLSGVSERDFTVKIGEADCVNIVLTPTILTCEPPPTRPKVRQEEYMGDNKIPVKVLVGQLKFDVGYISYIQNLWEYPLGRYGMIGVICALVLIDLVILCVCCGRRQRMKK